MHRHVDLAAVRVAGERERDARGHEREEVGVVGAAGAPARPRAPRAARARCRGSRVRMSASPATQSSPAPRCASFSSTGTRRVQRARTSRRPRRASRGCRARRARRAAPPARPARAAISCGSARPVPKCVESEVVAEQADQVGPLRVQRRRPPRARAPDSCARGRRAGRSSSADPQPVEARGPARRAQRRSPARRGGAARARPSSRRPRAAVVAPLRGPARSFMASERTRSRDETARVEERHAGPGTSRARRDAIAATICAAARFSGTPEDASHGHAISNDSSYGVVYRGPPGDRAGRPRSRLASRRSSTDPGDGPARQTRMRLRRAAPLTRSDSSSRRPWRARRRRGRRCRRTRRRSCRSRR